ncbi:hypothetical protein [Pseudoramibacter alactolyticus]|jgi:hypothetical protein
MLQKHRRLGFALAITMVCIGLLSACGSQPRQQKSRSTGKKTSEKTASAQSASTTSAQNYYTNTLYQNIFLQFQGSVAESQLAKEVKQNLSVLNTDTFSVSKAKASASHQATITVTEKGKTDPVVTFIFKMVGDVPSDGDECTGIQYSSIAKAVLVNNQDGAPTYYKIQNGKKTKVHAIESLTASVKKW